MLSIRPWSLLTLLISFPSAIYSKSEDTYVTYQNNQGGTIYLDNNRQPALYTESFGDCLGASQSLISVSRFDASLYMDNMTVSFHIAGSTRVCYGYVITPITGPVPNPIVVYIGVYAYGETRFELSWNPCGTDMIRYDLYHPIFSP